MTDTSKYKKLSPIDHVLLRPEMYVGSVETQPIPMFIYDAATQRMKWETMQVNHGLLKIVDEILLNASDNIQNSKRGDKQTYIHITLTDNGDIAVENDGAGIPIARSKEHRLYIPEMVFGHLLTSSNYHNDETSTTAGRHGYGAKLTNILSHKFSVVCRTKGREFHMSWSDHMRKATAPRISAPPAGAKGRNMTLIKFSPDYQRFGYADNKISDDMKAVLYKRIMDLAAMFPSIEIKLNGVSFGFKNFKDYAMLYSIPNAEGEQPPKPFVFETKVGSVAFIPQHSPGPKRIVGVVNGVVTYNGGTHCNATMDLLNGTLEGIARRLRKKDKIMDANRVSRYFTSLIFLIQPQPKFDSQSKGRLVSSVTIPRVPRQELDEYLMSMPFLLASVNSMSSQLAAELNKEMGAGKRLSSKALLSSIAKLVDATTTRFDGKNPRTLIVTEGDSAKALALNSLSSEQKKYCGVYPLRGKLLNVRNKNLKRLKNCKELQDLFLALGLELGKKDINPKELRYQRLLIMTDQDADGSHIKGLVINAFEALWPRLLYRNPGYISLFSTPIVKIKLKKGGKETIPFHSYKEYHKWQRANPNTAYTAKYYKGLGTSTTAEGKEYFQHMEKNVMKLIVDSKDKSLLDSVFDSQEVEWRKEWMTKANAFTGDIDIDRSKPQLTITDFVHKEMVHFALLGNARSLAHSVDGLKPSQRKILWAMLRRTSNDSSKVAQLSGYISEVASFHHGEASLQDTIIKMAQNFTGGNNINYLVPEGQFGSRQQLGSDHAAPRYIFTKLSRFARVLFPPEDDPLLDYVDEEGTMVEPNHYVPVIPTLLCNGSVGIGFGFSSNIPSYHPVDVSAAVRAMINGEAAKQVVKRLVPWAVGFQGHVRRTADGSFWAVGKYSAFENNRVHISELPWGMSIESFRAHVSTLAANDMVHRIADYSGANHIDIDLVLEKDQASTWAEMESLLAISQKVYVNGTVFSPNGTLSPLESDLAPILQWHYDRRLDLYKKRRQRKLGLLDAERSRLESTLAFVTHFRAGKIDIVNATDESLVKVCQKLNMVRVDDGFDYVLKKPITFFTKTSLEKLQADIGKVKAEITALQKMTPVKIWLQELDRFDQHYLQYEEILNRSILKEQRPLRVTSGEVVPALKQPTLQVAPLQGRGSYTPPRVQAYQAIDPPPPRRRPQAEGEEGEAAGGAAAPAGPQRVLRRRRLGRRGIKRMTLDFVAENLPRFVPRTKAKAWRLSPATRGSSGWHTGDRKYILLSFPVIVPGKKAIRSTQLCSLPVPYDTLAACFFFLSYFSIRNFNFVLYLECLSPPPHPLRRLTTEPTSIDKSVCSLIPTFSCTAPLKQQKYMRITEQQAPSS
eukprot:gene1292-744_t